MPVRILYPNKPIHNAHHNIHYGRLFIILLLGGGSAVSMGSRAIFDAAAIVARIIIIYLYIYILI